MKITGTALVVAMGLAAVSGATISPAAASAGTPPLTSIELTSSVVNITSSTGHQLALKVHSFTAPNQPSLDETDIALTREVGPDGRTGKEIHTWQFPMFSSYLKANPKGEGTLRMATPEMGSLGSLQLTMTPTGHITKQQCEGTVSVITSRVALAGTFYFKTQATGTHKWGAVGHRKAGKSFTFPGSSILTETFHGAAQCLDTTPPPPACETGTAWNTRSPSFVVRLFPDVAFTGYEAAGHHVVDGYRLTGVSGTRVTRVDEVIARLPKLKVKTVQRPDNPSQVNGTLVVTGKAPLSSGSATISGLEYEQLPQQCGGRGDTQGFTNWPNADFANGPARLTLRPQVFGAIHVPDNQSGFVGQTTFGSSH